MFNCFLLFVEIYCSAICLLITQKYTLNTPSGHFTLNYPSNSITI